MARTGQRPPYNKEKTNMVDFNAVPEDAEIFVDDDAPREETTVLDALRNELKREIKNEDIILTVPNRPGMSIKFSPNITAQNLQMWRKACHNKSMPDNFDGLKFSSIVVANTSTEVIYNGKVAVDPEGELLNFRNVKFLDMLDTKRAVDAVRRLYGSDGHVFVAADEILRASGYDGESQDQADPTLLS